MKSFVALSMAAGAYASSYSFELTASGGQSGTIGQLSDGQIRIGGGLPQKCFTIDNGAITDASGYGCLLTPEVEQFQCDLNKSPMSGFSIAANGTFEYSGSSVFYACPASDTEWNIYTTPVVGQAKCVEISLEATDCGSSTCSTVPASTVTVTSTVVAEASTVTVYECPTSPSVSLPISTISTTYVQTTPPVSVPVSSSSVVETTPPATTPIVTPTSYTTIESYTPSSSVIVVPTSTQSSVVVVPTSSTAPISETTYSETPSSSVVTYTSYSYTPTSSVPLTTAPTTFYTSTTTSYHWSNSTTTTAPTSTTSSVSTCVSTALTGTYTAGNYQYPHLIVPVSSTSPDTEYGTQYFGTISSNVSTIFNFDIPTSYSGKTCNLIFLLPLQSQLETSSYDFSGTGGVEFEQLSSPATTSTTYNNAPSVSADLGEFTLTEGSSTLISSFACQAGETVAYEAKAVGDTDLYFFQDYNPSPLGLYITVCE